MKDEKIEKRRKFIINTIYYAFIALLVFLGFKYVAKWVLPFILGFIIASMVKPSAIGLNKLTRINKKVCTGIVLVFYYALIIFLIWVLGARIVSSLKDLFTQLPSYYNESIAPFFNEINNLIIDLTSKISPDTLDQIYSMFETVSDKVREFIVSFSSGTVSYLANTTAKIPFFFISFVFTILSSIFISLDYDRIIEFIKKQFPESAANFMSDTKRHLGKTLVRYLRAYVIILVITFIELSIGLSILGTENAIGLAAIIAVADILPVLGTGGVLIPWAIISLINQNYFYGIGLIIIYVVVLVVRNFTEPKIVGDQLGLNPLVTLISIYVGYLWMGIFGMILLPVTVTILSGLNRSGKIKLWKE